jgi:predicted dehydrogenase
MAADKLKVGIVSANWGALAHLPAWRLLAEEVEVTAICTSRQETAEAAARQFEIARPFWSFEDMCADPNVDVIDAGTTPLLREKIVMAALLNNKHCVNQVPFATSLDSAMRLATTQRIKRVKGMVAPSVIGLPHLALMKEMIDEGEIGEVFQVQCSWQLSIFLQIHPDFPYTWFGKSGLGVSVTRNQGSHVLHALRHLFGPVDSVISRIDTRLKTWDIPGRGTLAAETDDTCHALLRFRSGAMGTIATSWTAADSPGFFVDALGSKGRIRLSAMGYPSIASAKLYFGTANLSMLPSGHEVVIPNRLMSVAGRAVAPVAGDQLNGSQRLSIARLFEGLIQSIRDGGEPTPDFARASEIQGIIEALYESDIRRAWVDTKMPAVV